MPISHATPRARTCVTQPCCILRLFEGRGAERGCNGISSGCRTDRSKQIPHPGSRHAAGLMLLQDGQKGKRLACTLARRIEWGWKAETGWTAGGTARCEPPSLPPPSQTPFPVLVMVREWTRLALGCCVLRRYVHHSYNTAESDAVLREHAFSPGPYRPLA